jgi:hypothetical protein
MNRRPEIEPNENPYPDKSKVEQSVDPNTELGRAISRCFYAVSVGDQDLLMCALDSLKTAVPNNIKTILDEIEEICTTTESRWKRPKASWANSLSIDPLSPVIRNEKNDLDYDPSFVGRRFEPVLGEDGEPTGRYTAIQEEGGPHWMSPIYSEEQVTNYNQEFRMIMTALEDNGLWWREKKDTEHFRRP